MAMRTQNDLAVEGIARGTMKVDESRPAPAKLSIQPDRSAAGIHVSLGPPATGAGQRRRRVGDEPVPGYRLAGFLGAGSFGEVWKAEGPGRVVVALKIVPLERRQALKEFRALKLVRNVKHVNLVGIQAFWVRDAAGRLLDDQIENVDALVTPSDATGYRGGVAELIIAMTLCDCNLLDHLAVCERRGLSGIPCEELLGYMEEAAKAIDFLNDSRHDLGNGPAPIHHLDIKPANIMLLGGSAVVGDFTLARTSQAHDLRRTQIGGSTAYISPEVRFENSFSPSSDQYSLAITYYELRTGKLPFPEDSSLPEICLRVERDELDFSAVNEAERAVIRRATSLDPAARYGSAREFVLEIRRAYERSTQPAAGRAAGAGGMAVAIVDAPAWPKPRRKKGAGFVGLVKRFAAACVAFGVGLAGAYAALPELRKQIDAAIGRDSQVSQAERSDRLRQPVVEEASPTSPEPDDLAPLELTPRTTESDSIPVNETPTTDVSPIEQSPAFDAEPIETAAFDAEPINTEAIDLLTARAHNAAASIGKRAQAVVSNRWQSTLALANQVYQAVATIETDWPRPEIEIGVESVAETNNVSNVVSNVESPLVEEESPVVSVETLDPLAAASLARAAAVESLARAKAMLNEAAQADDAAADGDMNGLATAIDLRTSVLEIIAAALEADLAADDRAVATLLRVEAMIGIGESGRARDELRAAAALVPAGRGDLQARVRLLLARMSLLAGEFARALDQAERAIAIAEAPLAVRIEAAEIALLACLADGARWERGLAAGLAVTPDAASASVEHYDVLVELCLVITQSDLWKSESRRDQARELARKAVELSGENRARQARAYSAWALVETCEHGTATSYGNLRKPAILYRKAIEQGSELPLTTTRRWRLHLAELAARLHAAARSDEERKQSVELCRFARQSLAGAEEAEDSADFQARIRKAEERLASVR